MQIFRKFDGAQQEKLLRVAEAIYPARANVLAAGKKMRGTLSATDKTTKDLWWWNDFDGVRLPYAITTSAVVYYRQKIREFRGGDFKATRGIKMFSANMKYVSDIKYHVDFTQGKRKFRGVYVVKMQLIWEQTCGSVCGMYFNRERTVVLSKNGNVLAVSGDGAESVIVS